jgi:hypothetical protein
MTARERVPKKQCPQCGWDAEGKPVQDPTALTPSSGGPMKRVPPPKKFDYDCGNCGYRWIE